MVHYEGWSRKYDELLNISSKRVAPKGLYTDRQDIPRYRMCNQDRNPVNYAHVIYNPMNDARQDAAPQAAPAQPSDSDNNS